MQLRAEIEVEAKPELVWQVLTDTRRLHEWNPLITRIEGPLTQGSSIRVHVSLPGGTDRRIKARVVKADPGVELRFTGVLGMSWFLRGDHFAHLIAVDENRTRVVHGQDFEGSLVRLAPRAMTQAARGLTLLNSALKRHLETLQKPEK